MNTVDSTKNKLSLQEIMIRSIYDQKDSLTMPIEQALLMLVEELKMPGSEAIQFGNTVFISHYSQESPTCFMYALNVDTAKNYIKNGELYTRYLMKRGMKGFMTSFTQESFGVPFKQIERNNLGTVHSYKQGNRFVTAVLFNKQRNKQQEEQNA